MTLSLHNIVKRFGDQTVVNGVDLAIQDGEMFFLLGPSGCGKTTLLRMIAGFYDPDAGEIRFGSRTMNGVPPQDRNTALVFQNYAVWPHLSVFENVAYGLRIRKVAEPDLTERTLAALRQVKMDALRDRKPATLSGGQQQRVALARAVVVRPDLLLFDEPLSNLDAKLRLEMRDEFRRLHAQTRITSVYVTHDQEEALSMASRIAVMHGGIIQQVGSPADIYHKPANAFVAAFIGEMNFLPAASPAAQTLAPTAPASGQIGVRPEHLIVQPAAASAPGLPARVRFATFLGSKVQLTLTAGDHEFKAETNDLFAEGADVRISADPARIHAFPDGSAL